MSNRPQILSRILLVEVAPSDVYLLRKSFFQYGRNDWELLETPLLSDAINIGRHLQIHLVLLALNLSNSCELNRLKKFHFSFPRLPIIVLTTLSAHQLAQQTLAQGAQDYLFKEHTREGWFWRSRTSLSVLQYYYCSVSQPYFYS